jgi:hypothetical protein
MCACKFSILLSRHVCKSLTERLRRLRKFLWALSVSAPLQNQELRAGLRQSGRRFLFPITQGLRTWAKENSAPSGLELCGKNDMAFPSGLGITTEIPASAKAHLNISTVRRHEWLRFHPNRKLNFPQKTQTRSRGCACAELVAVSVRNIARSSARILSTCPAGRQRRRWRRRDRREHKHRSRCTRRDR